VQKTRAAVRAKLDEFIRVSAAQNALFSHKMRFLIFLQNALRVQKKAGDQEGAGSEESILQRVQL
jgi:hypothetical protein